MPTNLEDRLEHKEKREVKRRRLPRKATPKRLQRVALHYLERYSSSSENLRRVLMRRVERSALVHGTGCAVRQRDHARARALELALVDPRVLRASERAEG